MAEELGYVWNDLGLIRWPLFFSFTIVIGLALFSAVRLFRPGAMPDLRSKAWLDAILFWGGFERPRSQRQSLPFHAHRAG